MICRVCSRREAPPDQLYCPSCDKAVAEAYGRFQNTIEHAAAVELFGPRQSPAEAAAEIVEIPWTADELGRAIGLRMRVRGLETATLLLPGVGAANDRTLRMAGKWAGCVVERGTELDTLYVTGFNAPSPAPATSPSHPA